MKLTQTGVGTTTHDASVRDSMGHALLPIQAVGDGTTTFKVNGKVHPDAPWVEVVAADVTDFLDSISWLPFIQLEVTSGTGAVTLYIGEE